MTGVDPAEMRQISLDDELVFRLREGRRPVVYSDTITRLSYEIGMNVIHTGAVWAVGYVGDVLGLELDDGTIVFADDIEPDSLIVKQVES